MLNAGSNVYLDGYWQHCGYFNNLPSTIFNELTVREPFSSSFDGYVKALNSCASPVSIHVRHGDYISDSNANHLMGVMPLDYYYQAIRIIRERVKDPVFFIFSDNLGWVKDHLAIPEPLIFVDVEEGNIDYLELQLMSKCRHNILANSTFSWWGAFLNQAPDKVVIAPAKWVVPHDLNEKIKLQFPSWIKL